MTMGTSVPVNFRCGCGTEASHPMTVTATEWTCPACTRTWRAEGSAVWAILAGATELRLLRRGVWAVLALLAVVSVVLIVINPAWAVGLPVVAGIVALMARPTYRKRLERAKQLVRSPIGVRPA
ncbi:hypothetical protein [Gordonia sp. NPDC003429]